MTSNGPKIFHAPERKVERGRGCWNCTKFRNGEAVRKHYKARIGSERMGMLAQAMPAIERLGKDDGSSLEVAQEAGRLMRGGMDPAAAMGAALGKVHKDPKRIAMAINEARKQDSQLAVFDNMVAAGAIGVCSIGGAEGDFVDCRYLCDKWVGREGSSLATSGKPLDKLPEELKEEMK